MKLFNPYHYEKKGRKPKDEKNIILDEDYPASIYEALRHNKAFHGLVYSGPDPNGRDLDPIPETIRMDMAIKRGVSIDTPWNEITTDYRSKYRKMCCAGFIQTDIKHMICDQSGYHVYDGPIAKVLLEMLNNGRIDHVKTFLETSGKRLVTLPKSTEYHGKDVKMVFRKQFDAFVKPFIKHASTKVYPYENDWRVFLDLKRLQSDGNNFFEAYSNLMIQENPNRWLSDIQGEYILSLIHI